MCLHYKIRLVNTAYKNSCCLLLESYKTHTSLSAQCALYVTAGELPLGSEGSELVLNKIHIAKDMV
jgi:hypothetical protein